MNRLYHNGKEFILVPLAETTAPQIGDMPKRPQKAAFGHRGMPYRMRDFRPITNGNGYRPGPMLDMGHDQCRYFISDGIMCGAKTGNHPSYCEHHRAICCTGKFAWGSMRRIGLANGTHKEGWAK